MGVCYYLWRDDNKTAYDLGKSYGWETALGDGLDMVLTPNCEGCAELLGKLLAITLVNSGYWKQKDVDLVPTYFESVAADIAIWSEGKPFRYISENDGVIEKVSMEAYDRGDTRESWLTGSRFSAKILEASDAERKSNLKLQEQALFDRERIKIFCQNPECSEYHKGFVERSQGTISDPKFTCPCAVCGKEMKRL